MTHDEMLAAAKRLHARGCRGITNAAVAWRDLTFTEKLVWMNFASLTLGDMRRLYERTQKRGAR